MAALGLSVSGRRTSGLATDGRTDDAYVGQRRSDLCGIVENRAAVGGDGPTGIDDDAGTLTSASGRGSAVAHWQREMDDGRQKHSLEHQSLLDTTTPRRGSRAVRRRSGTSSTQPW